MSSGTPRSLVATPSTAPSHLPASRLCWRGSARVSACLCLHWLPPWEAGPPFLNPALHHLEQKVHPRLTCPDLRAALDFRYVDRAREVRLWEPMGGWRAACRARSGESHPVCAAFPPDPDPQALGSGLHTGGRARQGCPQSLGRTSALPAKSCFPFGVDGFRSSSHKPLHLC